MGIDCSCFHTDYIFGNVDIQEKAVTMPLYYELPSLPPSDCLYLKSLCRGYIFRNSMIFLTSPNNTYEVLSYPITALQSEKITEIEKNLPLMDFEPIGPVYLIEQEYYQGLFNRRCMKHGKGVLLLQDNRKYIGEFRLNKIHGYGRMIFQNGDVYEGEFKDDKVYGQGKYVHYNGSVYIGGFKNDKQHGKGVETWNRGSKYEGEYKNGMKHGKGKIQFSDGVFYEGDFFENRVEGKGFYQWSEDKWYKGDMVNSKMHGNGELHSASGHVYKGDFEEDLKHGYGICTWPDGRIYEGYWKEGVQHGEGFFTGIEKNGTKVKKKGIWNNGTRETWINEWFNVIFIWYYY